MILVKKAIIIFILVGLFINSPVHAQEEIQLKVYYIAFLPFDTSQDTLLFENPMYENIGGLNVRTFNFNETQKIVVVNKLKELIKNSTGKYPRFTENWTSDYPIIFSLMYGEKDQKYTFFLYPDFLIVEYSPLEADIGITNKTYLNSLGTFERGIRKVRSDILKNLNIKSGYHKNKIIIFCRACSFRDFNISRYKKFFVMESHTLLDSNPNNFLLYETPLWKYKQQDATVVNFDPENKLIPILEFIEVVIPYSNKRIRAFSGEISNSGDRLNDISVQLSKTNSTKQTEKVIEELKSIEDPIAYYNKELKRLKILKTKELKLLSENRDYLQIKNSDNKTYEEIIENHLDLLGIEIIFLEKDLDFLDSKYWSILSAANARLSYQQQNEQFKKTIFWTIIVTVVGVALIDIVIRSFQDELKVYIRRFYFWLLGNSRKNLRRIFKFIKRQNNHQE